MVGPAIRVENLSKCYRIGAARGGPYRTLRESISEAPKTAWRRARRLVRPRAPKARGERPSGATFNALDDVSFEVRPGEVVGIIGRNGAGKSTLLKVLSKITEPSDGRILLRGRVGSLLEVGTGFHPELSGRENIYLNGAILGMARREIARKFDEIVAFAEVERFLDTPVKRYSSGMYVRLAFAVAAHLEPEIMVVDEVLAVGDMAFQRKCLGKMHEVSDGGRTVLFVSHNMGAIQSLCTRCLVMDAGRVAFDGGVACGIDRYGDLMRSQGSVALIDRPRLKGTGVARFTRVSLEDLDGNELNGVGMGDPFRICLDIECTGSVQFPQVVIAFTTLTDQRLFRLYTRDQDVDLPSFSSTCRIECEVESMPLTLGTYSISLSMADGANTIIDEIDQAATIEVLAKDVFGTGQLPKGKGDLVFVGSAWSSRGHDVAAGGPRGGLSAAQPSPINDPSIIV
jgi:lipopolysaccharide transport system ATP-binding protein